MKKHIALVLACLMLIGCLVGCGGDKPEISAPESDNSSVSTDFGVNDTTTTDDGVDVEDTTEAVDGTTEDVVGDTTTEDAVDGTTMQSDDSTDAQSGTSTNAQSGNGTTTGKTNGNTINKTSGKTNGTTTGKTSGKTNGTTTGKTSGKTNGTTTGKTSGKTTASATTKTTANANANWSIETAPMPTANLSNKTLSYYGWVKMDNYYESGIPIDELFAKEFGVTYKETIGTHENYWDTLATLKASGNAPDMVFMPNWNFYPSPIVNDLLEPLDSLIDFTDPLWQDTDDLRKQYMWNGKTYLVFPTVAGVNSWMFYNTQVFKNKGVKTPREYYLEGNWTWDVMTELANKFVNKMSNGTVNFFGVGFKENHFVASSGVELVQKQGNKGVLNMKDGRLAKVMNYLYDLGQGGSGALAGSDDIKLFCGGRLAMFGIVANASVSEFYDSLTKKGKLDWVPMPKVDKNGEHYLEVRHDPNWAIVSGAKNKEAAALFIRFQKWCKLGSTPSFEIPVAENAATKKYASQLTGKSSPWWISDLFSVEQQQWSAKLAQHKKVSMSWTSWLGGDKVMQGYNYIWSGTKKWSAVVEEVYPIYDSILKSY